MLIVIISIDTMGIDGLNPFVSMDSIEGTHSGYGHWDWLEDIGLI